MIISQVSYRTNGPLVFYPFALMLLVSNEKTRANFHLCSAINIDSVIVSGSLKS